MTGSGFQLGRAVTAQDFSWAGLGWVAARNLVTQGFTTLTGTPTKCFNCLTLDHIFSMVNIYEPLKILYLRF